jgi:conjugal transfer pilin signal peptidase TrbI
MANKFIKLCLYLALPILGVYAFSSYYSIGINMTDSLPDKIYLISKGNLPKAAGEYISFNAPNNKMHEQAFLKLVGGIEGDIVKEESRKFYINGEFIGYAKEYNKKGEKTELGFTGVIPKGCYFVYSDHKDSYDSKYKNIGLICAADVIGSARPII